MVPALVLAAAATARAQSQPDHPRWALDLGAGISPSINGNVNSGAIGVLQDQAVVFLPNSYGGVYGTGIDLRIGGGYMFNDLSEVRGVFVYQSADANLVRMGDIGSSSLYAQYSDYKSLGLDLGFRRYFPVSDENVRFYSTDFYDRTAAFTWSVNVGALFKVADNVALNAQLGLRHVSGLDQVDQLVGSGLDDINNDTARLTFPIVIGVRFGF
jgi:opacity protein-like surface antigen